MTYWIVSSKTGEGISEAFIDLAQRMIIIANEAFKDNKPSFVSPMPTFYQQQLVLGGNAKDEAKENEGESISAGSHQLRPSRHNKRIQPKTKKCCS